jgi:putative endonuclease
VSWSPTSALAVIPGNRCAIGARRGKGIQASKRMSYFVYMLASKRNGTLHTDVTNDLGRRLGEHKEKFVPGFTKRHGVDILVWYEMRESINATIAREKQIKSSNRAWKVRTIEENNSG